MKLDPKLPKPPETGTAFLEWYCSEEFLEEVQGDLKELFLTRLDERGSRRAKFLYWLDVLRFFRPYLFRKKLFQLQPGGPIMFKNYFKVALRNMLKFKGYSFINISGLVIGLVTCILILLYVQDELSYDKFHPNVEQIYRVTTEEVKDGNFMHEANSFGPVAPALLNDFPEIEQAVRFFPYSLAVKRDEQGRFQEDGFAFADSTFFEMFSFKFRMGVPETALESPYAIVLTEKTAQKYFGNENPIGQVLTVEDQYDFKVTGVVELPANSHIQFDLLASMGSVRDILGWALTSWHYPPMYTYIQLPQGYKTEKMESQFPAFLGKNMGSWAPERRKLHLQPLTAIRLHSNLQNEIAPTGNIAYVYIFLTVAFFILLIACINFMNLATARSTNRAKEVGLRKVLGAQRSQLVSQFFGESMFYAFLSLILALVLVEFLMPYFNQLVEKQLDINYAENWFVLLGFIGLTFTVGLLAGSYPAALLSRFRPVKVLQGGKLTTGGSSKIQFRSVLVVLQFAISIGLIINSNVIRDQLNFIKQKNLGFSKEQIIVVPVRDEVIQQNWLSIKNTLLANSNIQNVTATSTIPGIDRDMDFPIKLEGMTEYVAWNMPTMLVDHDFLKTFEMEIVKGRDFSTAFTTDTSDAMILNEAAVSRLGWTSPLGKKLIVHSVASGGDKKGRIIGVVKDFHFRTLHHKIDPLVITISPLAYYYDNLAVKVSTQNIPDALAFLEATWGEIVPNRPFEYNFLDSVFEQLYRKEAKLGEIFSYFSGLAIFIGCLGLFGLTSFTAEQRTKEIGVRKVLGASVPNIVLMLSKELMALIVIAFIIASPIAYYGMSKWLQDFTYTVDISMMTFILSGLLALLIALLTVSYQAIKAALSNPVDALRYE